MDVASRGLRALCGTERSMGSVSRTLHVDTRANMDDGPLPEYLMEMLRKDGIVDADGKPLQEEEVVHPYDDEDVYGTGSDRQRDADAANTEVNARGFTSQGRTGLRHAKAVAALPTRRGPGYPKPDTKKGDPCLAHGVVNLALRDLSLRLSSNSGLGFKLMDLDAFLGTCHSC